MAADQDERYAFTTEWYDPNASMFRRYQLLFYVADNTIELYDIKNKRLFLKRSKCPQVKFSDLFIGAVVNVHSRQLTVTDFGDEFTARRLISRKEKTVGFIKPHCVSKTGEILKRILKEGFVLAKLRMVQLSKKEADELLFAQFNSDPLYSDLLEYVVQGPIVAFEIMGSDAVAKWLEILGPMDSSMARQDAPESLRAQFGTDRIHNVCHGSDSIGSAQMEAEFFFGPKSRQNTAKFHSCTLGILKPHAVMAGLTGDVLAEIASSGLEITALQLFNVEKANAQEFYEVYKGVVAEYNQMVEELISGPCIVFEVCGEDAHGRFRELAGPADPEIARHLRPHTLRAKFGVDKIKNTVHCTDLPDDSLLEVEYFFKILDS